MKNILFLLIIILTKASSYSQENIETQAVKNVVMNYVEAFYEGDTAKILKSILPAVKKLGYYQDKGSVAYISETMSFQQMIEYALYVKKSNHLASGTSPKEVTVFDVQDQTASAKLKAWWGTDYLLLGKYNGQWKIVQVLWQSAPLKK